MRKLGSLFISVLLMGLSGCNPVSSDAQSVAASHAATDVPQQRHQPLRPVAAADRAGDGRGHRAVRSGGDLGSFGPGQMVKEFDTVVFSAPVGVVQGPVKTQFGYHLLEVTSRQD